MLRIKLLETIIPLSAKTIKFLEKTIKFLEKRKIKYSVPKHLEASAQH